MPDTEAPVDPPSDPLSDPQINEDEPAGELTDPSEETISPDTPPIDTPQSNEPAADLPEDPLQEEPLYLDDIDPALLPLALTPLDPEVSGYPDEDPSNQPPYFDNLTDQIIYAGDLLELRVLPRDPDGGVPGQFSLPLPEYSTYTDNLDGSRLFRWQPLQPQVGITELTFVAVDPNHPQFRTTQTIRVQVVMPDDQSTIPNPGPVLNNIDPHVVRTGDTVVLAVKAEDPNGTHGPIEALNAPENSSLDVYPDDPAISIFRWQTTAEDTGVHSFGFRAIDAVDPSLTNERYFSVEVAPPGNFVRAGLPLRTLAEHTGRLFGTAMLLDWQLRPDADLYADTAALEFNMVTPENAMKWGHIHPEPNEYDWEAMDRLALFARSNNMLLHGHPLIWHRQLPKWVQRLQGDQVRSTLLAHIREVTNRYNNSVKLWDVVNEALEEDGSLRTSVWSDALGETFIDLAFDQANRYAPEATLIYNDYDVAWHGPKGDAMVKLIERLLTRGVPIDGVGFQMHVYSTFTEFEAVAQKMQVYADLGLAVYITELDVRLSEGSTLDDQADTYRRVVELCLAQPACKAIQTWGFTDRYSWYAQGQPLLLDRNYQVKPAYRAIQQALGG